MNDYNINEMLKTLSLEQIKEVAKYIAILVKANRAEEKQGSNG